MNKLAIATLLSLAFVAGCDDAKNESAANPTQGNFSAKVETLSSQNEGDIKADLTALNGIINAYNTKATELAQKLITASKDDDSQAILAIFKESQASLESANNALLALNLRSSELQKLRTDIYQGNMMSVRFYELYAKENKSENDKKELVLLQKQAITLQQSAGMKLDQLNSQYKVQ